MVPLRKLFSAKTLTVSFLAMTFLWLLSYHVWNSPTQFDDDVIIISIDSDPTQTPDTVVSVTNLDSRGPLAAARTDNIDGEPVVVVRTNSANDARYPSHPVEEYKHTISTTKHESATDMTDIKVQSGEPDRPVVVDVDLEDNNSGNTRFENDFVAFDLEDGGSEAHIDEDEKEALNLQYEFKGMDESEIVNVLSRAKYHMQKIRQNYQQLGVDVAMLQRAIVRHESVDKLKNVLTRTLLTGRPVKLGVIGGSISAGALLPSKSNIFALVFSRILQSILGVPVPVRRGAISACGSNYFTYCSTIHLNVNEMDFIIAEHAANDNWKLGSTFSQERLLRFLLRLPKQPQVMYVNFLLGTQMKPNLCYNAELKELTPLSEHYSVPAISLRDAICPMQISRFKELFAKDGIHPSAISHEIVSVFLLELVTSVLYDVGTGLLNSAKNGDTSYMAALQPQSEVKPTELPSKLWPETQDILSQRCWSTLQPISDREGALKPAYAPGWTFSVPAKRASDGLSVRSSWYTTKAQQIMAFPVIIEKVNWSEEYTCNVTLFMFTCPTCGSVQVSLYEEDTERDSMVASSKDEFTGRLRTADLSGVTPGNYTLSMMTVETKPFKLVAIATHCDIP